MFELTKLTVEMLISYKMYMRESNKFTLVNQSSLLQYLKLYKKNKNKIHKTCFDIKIIYHNSKIYLPNESKKLLS